MTWQFGAILVCLALVGVWLLSEAWHARGMRRRRRKARALERYCRMEWRR